MYHKILIIDFGSQYTQLIARRVRELEVFCEIQPFNHLEIDKDKSLLKGVILSGSPSSVTSAERYDFDFSLIEDLPILGICYGAQLIAQKAGGTVEKSTTREYGRATLSIEDTQSKLLQKVTGKSMVWMSHADTILTVPDYFKTIASSDNIPIAAYQLEGKEIYGIQFHPEVTHSQCGAQILKNFVLDICSVVPNWTPKSFVEETIQTLSEKFNTDKVVLGLSGGVDSSVAALLIHQAIGKNLTCIFVDNGLLRKNEFTEVLQSYEGLGLNVKGVDAKHDFFEALQGVTSPEAKRKAIGKVFIDVFEKEANEISGVKWLGQGTIYPDVVESISVKGLSASIKSHHNVGGLPERMNLKVAEPLNLLFKDEVRKVGKSLNLPATILNRHPFPGPGLGIRILGEVTPKAVRVLQEVDYIFISGLKEHNLYNKVWQAGSMLLPIRSVGVMGDERTYEQVVALRAVTSLDGMTADWAHLPMDFLSKISNDIINKVEGINRVVYDISSKPPSTIEWE